MLLVVALVDLVMVKVNAVGMVMGVEMPTAIQIQIQIQMQIAADRHNAVHRIIAIALKKAVWVLRKVMMIFNRAISATMQVAMSQATAPITKTVAIQLAVNPILCVPASMSWPVAAGAVVVAVAAIAQVVVASLPVVAKAAVAMAADAHRVPLVADFFAATIRLGYRQLL